MKKASIAILGLVAVIALACAPKARGPFEDPAAAAAADAENGVVLAVRNQNFLDMVIYILDAGGGPRQRLGVAGGNQTAYFNIPKSWIVNNELRFMADPIGSTGTPISDKVLVEPGDSLFLTIPAH